VRHLRRVLMPRVALVRCRECRCWVGTRWRWVGGAKRVKHCQDHLRHDYGTVW
jgi:hypothetical protein